MIPKQIIRGILAFTSLCLLISFAGCQKAHEQRLPKICTWIHDVLDQQGEILTEEQYGQYVAIKSSFRQLEGCSVEVTKRESSKVNHFPPEEVFGEYRTVNTRCTLDLRTLAPSELKVQEQKDENTWIAFEPSYPRGYPYWTVYLVTNRHEKVMTCNVEIVRSRRSGADSPNPQLNEVSRSQTSLNWEMVPLNFSNRSLAERMIPAFKDAIASCGGKEDLY